MSYDFSYSGAEDEVLMVLLGFYGIVWGIMLLVEIGLYVVRSLSVQTIAKRRGLESTWLSWLPIGHEWILGSLSDQYKYLTQGKVQNRRKILLGLGIATVVGYLVGVASVLLIALSEAMSGVEWAGGLLFLAAWLVCAGCGITSMVFGYMCKYDVYKSCDPKNAVAFLVVGIFFGVAEPFFLLACRKKDLGMPPRKDAAPAAPQAQPEAKPAETPVQTPVLTQPAADAAALPEATVIQVGPVQEDAEAPAEDAEVPAEDAEAPVEDGEVPAE